MTSISNDQSGIILTLASSLACILGSLIIYSDVVWRWFFPSTKFYLNNNQHFLICSLSLSSGILLFTSMFKLLPQGLKYFEHSTILEHSPKAANFALIGFYLLGVAICASINAVIHTLTSQSVVHCIHEGNSHGHSHEHERDHEHGPDCEIINHSNEVAHVNNMNPNQEPLLDSNRQSDPLSIPNNSSISMQQSNNGDMALEEECNTSERQPLLQVNPTISLMADQRNETEHNTIKEPIRRQSLLDITDWKLRRKKSIGKCMGYASVGCCSDGNGECKDDDPHNVYDFVDAHTQLHRHEHLINQPTHSLHKHNETTDQGSEVFTNSTPSDSVHTSSSLNKASSIPDLNPTRNSYENLDFETSNFQDPEVLHHHHVSTRYSHLFSIGAQTAFAISVHKIPEGILTFATSHANKELGFSVFLALAIHNFSEGFTIAFPLFLALGSRSIAVLAAIVLGGFSQPLGALLAWVFFHYENIPSNGPQDKSNLIFGVIVSITAGFLSIIGLQMYGTAIAFGGQQRIAMFYAFLGIAFIGTGYCLTAS